MHPREFAETKLESLRGNPRSLEPVMLTIADTVKIAGMSRSAVYRLLAAGELEARKAGSRTLITWASLSAVLEAMPTAQFRRPKASG
jgi:predicted DNA-binding transcriptional regulator AlpA